MSSELQGTNSPDGPSFRTLVAIGAAIVVVAFIAATVINHFGGTQNCVMQSANGCVTVK